VRRRFLGGQLELSASISETTSTVCRSSLAFSISDLAILTCCSCASLATARLAFFCLTVASAWITESL